MRLGALVLLGVVAAPQGEPPPRFEKLTTLLRDAKSLQVAFTSEVKIGGKPTSRDVGTLSFRRGGRARLVVESEDLGDRAAPKRRTEFRSDGKTLLLSRRQGDQAEERRCPVPEGQDRWIPAALAGSGITWFGAQWSSVLEQERSSGMPVRGELAVVEHAALGGRERSGDRDLQELRLLTAVRGPGAGNTRLEVSVWVDVERNLPARAVVTDPEAKQVFTETYASFRTDVEIDPATFEVPAPK